MSMATMITKEVDVHAFQAGILLAQADLLSPVAIQVVKGPYVPQTLKDFYDVMKSHPNQWSYYAGPAGIGQYSLITGRPAGVLARVDSYFRIPSDEEMGEDVQSFGEQVIGPAVSQVPDEQREKYKNTGIYRVFGEDFYFGGPTRLDKTVFLTRVFPGGLPDDISKLNKDIEGVSEVGEMIFPQGYHFLHADNGNMRYLPFRKPTDYDPAKLTDFGKVRMEREKLMFYSADGDVTVDISNTSYR
jgi:hypothetical protein